MPDLRPLLRAMLDKILNPIVDLILGYSEIDFEKIITEEREKADRRRDRTPPKDRPEPAE